MTTVEILKKAKESLTPETWGQGECPPGGRICAAVAIGRAASTGSDGTTFSIALRSPFDRALRTLRDGADVSSIPDWNDTPGRTLDEVHAAFDRAIALASKPQAPGDGNG